MAYASLVCLTNTLHENIQLNLIPQNSQYIQTLLQEASFFQKFIENSSNKSSETAKYLESRIRDLAFKAIDIIDSHVANRLDDDDDESVICLASLFEEPNYRDECLFKDSDEVMEEVQLDESEEPEVDWDDCLVKELDEAMEEINSIKQEVKQMGEKEKDNEEEEEENNDEPHFQSSISQPAGSSRTPSHGMTTNTMVGLDDQLKEIKSRLVSGSSQREIVALVGMGGIGKTTLARKVYDDKSISSHFDIRGWATVSQQHNVRNILLDILDSMKISLTDELRREDEGTLKDVLYKSILHRRYLIVLDDMWDIKVFNELRGILVDDGYGSRILLTTRLKSVAEFGKNCPPHHVRFLNDKESWHLFCKKVFGDECCPPGLEKVGEEILRNCRGLPLAINVIGGHLSKATRTKHYWRSVAKNLSETISLEDDGNCSRILSLSYKHLTHHLKGCLLYMSIFPEDCLIKVSVLLNLWIASGLIKQEESKSLKDIANEYFLDFVERNLILVWGRKFNGKIEYCKVHDLMRDLFVKEAKNEKFFHITDKTFYYDGYIGVDHVGVALHCGGLRAFYCDGYKLKHRLWTMVKNQANLRYLCHYPHHEEGGRNSDAIPFHKLVHLHTIHTPLSYYDSELNIWEMPQLRHVRTLGITLPNPPPSEIEGPNSLIVLEKLETFVIAQDLILTDEVLQGIPNLKRLGFRNVLWAKETDLRHFRLNNLVRLHKLESIMCLFGAPVLLGRDITFPHPIKKLTLARCLCPWKDMTVIGSLPNLEVLKLEEDSFIGKQWEPNEGEFLNLKTLYLYFLDLVHWRADAVHFPMLQHLKISSCRYLLEIPSGIGEVPTLEFIGVYCCRSSVETSARQIEEEQHDSGNEGFLVDIMEDAYEASEIDSARDLSEEEDSDFEED